MVTLDYAVDAESKVLKYVDDVAVGLNCNCICPICKEPLIAYNQGFQQAHHFGHKSGVEHDINPMTRLHVLAQIIIAKSFHFKFDYLPDYHIDYVNYDFEDMGLYVHSKSKYQNSKSNIVDCVFDSGEIEFVKDSDLGSVRYDVYFPNARLGVEIYVTHGVDFEKEKKICSAGDWCLEIDLSEVSRDIEYSDLEKKLDNVVFSNADFDDWIFGVGKYYDYLKSMCTKYNSFLEDVLNLKFVSKYNDFDTKRRILLNFFKKFGNNAIGYNMVYDLTQNGLDKLSEKLTNELPLIPMSKLNHFRITVIKQPIPRKYGIRNVSLRWYTQDAYGHTNMSITIRVGWLYLPN